jgi:hypothetical protein
MPGFFVELQTPLSGSTVYSLFMLCVALIVALLVGWHKYPDRRVLLSSGLLLTGFAFFAHLLIVTLITGDCFAGSWHKETISRVDLYPGHRGGHGWFFAILVDA